MQKSKRGQARVNNSNLIDLIWEFCICIANMPTWDETKRNLNIRKHGLDFVGCEAIFDAPVSVTEDAC